MEKLEQGKVDENIIRNLDGAGSFRANRLRDLVGPDQPPFTESERDRIAYALFPRN